MNKDFSCTSDFSINRPVCPLMSHQYNHSGVMACLGPKCIFCRGGACLIAKGLEKYIRSKDSLTFMSDEDLNEIEPMA